MQVQNPYGKKSEDATSSMGQKYQQIKKQIEAKQEAEKTKTLKQVVKNETEFKKDMAKFYSVNPGATKDIDLQQFIGQKGKENNHNNSNKNIE